MFESQKYYANSIHWIVGFIIAFIFILLLHLLALNTIVKSNKIKIKNEQNN